MSNPVNKIDTVDKSDMAVGAARRAWTRRQFVAGGVAAAGGLVFGGARVFGQSGGTVEKIEASAAKSPVTVQTLRGGIRVLSGSGGNIAVLPGRDGKLLVDAGIAVSRKKVRDALDGISGDPITNLINTHWHFDHTSGNAWLHDAGASITAHEITRQRLSVKHRVEGWRFDFPAAPEGALPTVVFKDDFEMTQNGQRIVLQHYKPAHTDCDISVYFPDLNVLHVGDTLWNGFYPFPDYSSGGTIDGSIEAAEENVRRTTDNTVVIPGHGPVGNRADLIAFRDMLVAIRSNVAALKTAGRSLEETIAAKPTAAFDDKWGRFVITPRAFTELVYQGV